ncbi:MAG: family P-type ATPase [Mycobacterium sp.]|nr:family P-type ATPase [Mycobacterium sp.]
MIGTGLLGAASSSAWRVGWGAGRRAAGLTRSLPLAAELRSVLDPRPHRHQRRVAVQDDRVHVEVRGLAGPAGARLARLLEDAFAREPGITWWQINAVTGRVVVGLDTRTRTAADVVALVRLAEERAETADVPWSRQEDLPGDREPLLASALALTADLAGFAAAVALRAVPLPDVTRPLQAAVALVDAQPRLRRAVERHLGMSRADLVITVGNAAAQAAGKSGAGLLVDAGQRFVLLLERQAGLRAWQGWERRLHGPGGVSVPDPIHRRERPRPLPQGPIERFADQAATGSLLAAATSVAGRQGMSEVADAVLVGVPRAARSSREAFAGVLSASLSRRGALTLDSSVWRRLDRVTAVVVDATVLRGGPPLVVGAECSDEDWTTARVWTAAQRLLGGFPARAGDDLALLPARRGGPGRRVWRDLTSRGRPVGRALVGTELRPGAGAVLAAARSAGLRVVLAREPGASELRSRVDEVLPDRESVPAAVRRLQAAGHVVAVVSAGCYRALAESDLGVGVAAETAGGRTHVPWTADVVCDDLAVAAAVLAATAPARAASERGTTLALSASVLGALLLVAGARRGAWHRAVGPVTGASLLGLLTGARVGWAAGRPSGAGPPAELPWHALDAEDVVARLPAPPHALDGQPAAPHGLPGLVLAGSHRLPSGQFVVGPVVAAVRLGRSVRQELADPLTPVLTVGAAASAILGSPTDAVLVGSVMGVNALVSAVQRQRADRALRALLLGERVPARRLSGRTSRRVGGGPDGVGPVTEVTAEALRAGDVIALAAGDVVPADARLLEVDDLELDESGLTGESVTVDKQLAATPGAPLGERACMVYEGSTVVAGRGRALVVAVGGDTQAGRAVAAVRTSSGPTGVQAQLRALTDKALPLTLGGGVAVSALGFLRAQALRAAVADGVAVAVAAVPEGLPLVATVAQLAAARRLSRQGVLVRSSRTVEALGRVDTICFDKTGTLTEGRLSLVQLADLARGWDVDAADDSPDARRLLRAAARACPRPEEGPAVHATDRAVLEAADTHLGRQANHVWDPLDEVPFESNRGYAATLGHSRRHLRLVVKGAPEVVLPRCARVLDTAAPQATARPLTGADRDRAQAVVHRLAAQGLRVLVVARRELGAAPDDVERAVDQLTLMGFIGLADTPREATLPVVEELLANGLRVCMITGDHPVTAQAIAAQLGILHGTVVTGEQLDAVDDQARRELVGRSAVFARVTPEQKVRIVAALQQGGRVVAMTGDGSNDAAAIRLADVGIGLAARGSAAARGAADVVLVATDLTLLLDALVEGRMMWERVRDAVAVLVGGNAGEVAFTVLGTALSGRAPVGTRQFLLVNLLTDMFPAMAVALAHPRRPSAAPGQVNDPKQRAAEAGADLALVPRPQLGAALVRSITVRGSATAAGAGAAWLLGRGTPLPRRASTMGLVALVGTQLGQTLLLGGRSPLVWLTVGLSGAVLVAVVQTPGLSHFFGCTPLDPAAWLVVGGCAASATVGSVLVPRVAGALRTVAAGG